MTRRLASASLGRLRAALGSERGNAIVVVMGTLLVLGVLSTAVASTATQSNRDATKDRNSKRALAAAESGLHVAQLALRQATGIGPGQCLVAGAGNPTAFECPTGATGDIGNGASYTYHVSQAVNGATVACPAGGAEAVSGGERCITSIGNVNGVKRRVQLMVRQVPGTAIWQQVGIVGKDWVEMKNNATINSSIGTNGSVVLKNNNEITETLLLPPSAVIDGDASQITAVPKRIDSPTWNLPDVEVPAPVPPVPGTPYNNAALSPSHYKTAGLGQPQRLFKVNGATYTMPAGTYNFCEVDLGNHVTINVTGPVRIYVDSPARPGSLCTSGGRFRLDNHVTVNGGGNPANFAVFVYGTRNEAANDKVNCPNGQTGADVFLCNSIAFNGTMYAPESSVTVANNVEFVGGVASNTIEFKNNAEFFSDGRAANVTVGPPTGQSRVRWRECRRDPATATDPESGC